MWENKILGAMLLLGTFTAHELQKFTRAKITTVRDVIKRNKKNGCLTVVGDRPNGQSGRNESLLQLTNEAAKKIAEDLQDAFSVIDKALTQTRPDSVHIDDRDTQLNAAADLIDEAVSSSDFNNVARASLLALADIELQALEGVAARQATGEHSVWSNAIAAVRDQWLLVTAAQSQATTADGTSVPTIGIPVKAELLSQHCRQLVISFQQDSIGTQYPPSLSRSYLHIIVNPETIREQA